MNPNELEENARHRAAALEPVVEQLKAMFGQNLLVIDLLVQIREELKRGRV